jgi:hypothetical protein
MENVLDWAYRMHGSNENLIQEFIRRLEGLIHLSIAFKQFSFCYATCSVFSPEILTCLINLFNLSNKAPCGHVGGLIAVGV